MEVKLTPNALKVLQKRYLKRDDNGTPTEVPEDMLKRVAKNIASADKSSGATDGEVRATEKEFYRVMASLEFLPNSPTLMNAGRELQQLSACFVLPVGDSMDEIFDAVKYTALIHQTGGGTGFSFSRLRPKGDLVSRTKGQASGPLSFMKAFNAATETVKQGGTRRGANMGILRVDHPDIMEFISCKDGSGKLENFNISVAVTDAFMKAVEENGKYALINPRSGAVVKEVLARGVFNSIVEMAWKTGDPGLIFIDRLNKHNPTPHVGQFEATNPCGEQPLLPFESCNLGSINLAKMATGGRVDYGKLKTLIKTAVHFLDNVIDMNKFPLPQIEEMTKANRKIGLGVMGFADMLIMLGIPYNSEEAVKVAGEVMSFIQREGREASKELAQTRGTFPNWEGSIYNDHMPVRNATVTTIAPTGTISIIAGASSGVEPLFGISFVRNVMDNTDLPEVNPLFEKVARERGFYSEALMRKIAKEGTVAGMTEIPDDVRRVFVTAHDISPEWHLKIQAAFQKSTDNAVSKTINMPHSATKEDIAKAYKMAFDLDCKGITIYRDGSKDTQVITVGEKVQTPKIETGKAIDLPRVLSGERYRYRVGCGSFYILVYRHPVTKKPIEVFLEIGKSGGCLASMVESIGKLISTSLRAGVEPGEVINQLIGVKCDQIAFDNGQRIESCSDAIGKALREALGEEPPITDLPPIIGGSDIVSGGSGTCPDCGAGLVSTEGCRKCSANCGYSQC